MRAKLMVTVVGASILGCLVVGCCFAEQLEPEWILAYACDFSKPELAPEWVVTAGNAKITDGMLVLQAVKGNAEIVLQNPCFISPGVRMEFTANISDSAKLGDISPFLNSNYNGTNQTTGCDGSYLFQFGAEQNTKNRLRRVGQIIEETVNSKILIERQHRYHIIVENDSGHIRFQIDGATIFEWNDPHPLGGPKYCHIGFYTWESEIHLDNIKVYHKVPKS